MSSPHSISSDAEQKEIDPKYLPVESGAPRRSSWLAFGTAAGLAKTDVSPL